MRILRGRFGRITQPAFYACGFHMRVHLQVEVGRVPGPVLVRQVARQGLVVRVNHQVGERIFAIASHPFVVQQLGWHQQGLARMQGHFTFWKVEGGVAPHLQKQLGVQVQMPCAARSPAALRRG